MHYPLIPGMYNFGAGFLGFFGVIVWGLVCLLMLTVSIALIFLLVRFLLVATRAAQLYVAKNEPPRPVQPRIPAAPTTASTPAPKSPIATSAPNETKPFMTNATKPLVADTPDATKPLLASTPDAAKTPVDASEATSATVPLAVAPVAPSMKDSSKSRLPKKPSAS